MFCRCLEFIKEKKTLYFFIHHDLEQDKVATKWWSMHFIFSNDQLIIHLLVYFMMKNTGLEKEGEKRKKMNIDQTNETGLFLRADQNLFGKKNLILTIYILR